MKITGAAGVYALIGNPVAHSFSPVFWNAAFSATSMNAVYVPLPVNDDVFETAIKGLICLGIQGFNITKPYKERIVPMIDAFVGPAEKIGSVNTVKCLKNGRFEGANTDVFALLALLENLPPVKTALLLGAGGAARAVLWGLCTKSVEMIYWTNRHEDRARNPFAEYDDRIRYVPWNTEAMKRAMQEADLVINATTLGWNTGDDLPLLREALSSRHTYLDLNYSRCSQLIRRAQEAGATTIDGTEFLLQQGAKAFEYLTGASAPVSVMRQSIQDCFPQHFSHKEGSPS
jgi:shikimate dehydrogenase